MKKDIEIPKVEGVYIAIVPSTKNEEEELWDVYIVNTNSFTIDAVLINSKGYGEKDGEKQQTSTMRRNIETLPGNSYGIFETIHSSVFHLTNEFFVTYFKGNVLYDKNYVFLPETIIKDNFTKIPLVNKSGILHD